MALHGFQEHDRPIGEPGITPVPEDTAEIAVLLEGPAMIEETGAVVCQILNVEQVLVNCFVDPFLIIAAHAHLAKEQHGHEQGVGPKLFRVPPHIVPIRAMAGHVFKAAHLGLRQGMNQIIRPFLAQRFPFRQIVALRQVEQGKEGSRGVDIDGRQADGQVVFHPLEQECVVVPVPSGRLQLQQAVQAHALGPVPFLDAKIPGKHALFPVFLGGILGKLRVGRVQVHELKDDQIQFLVQQLLVHGSFLTITMKDAIVFYFL